MNRVVVYKEKISLSAKHAKLDAEHNNLDCYTLSEQPMTCGICGARTSFEEEKDGRQNHNCLNLVCSYQFIAVDSAAGKT